MTEKQKSTAQKKLEAVESLKARLNDKTKAGTIFSYVRNQKLNRSEIAIECGFSSNDLLASELKLTEEMLIEQGILRMTVSDEESEVVAPGALETKLTSKDREIKSLRERLAINIAENEDLKRQLASGKSILDDIIPSGRRVEM